MPRKDEGIHVSPEMMVTSCILSLFSLVLVSKAEDFLVAKGWKVDCFKASLFFFIFSLMFLLYPFAHTLFRHFSIFVFSYKTPLCTDSVQMLVTWSPADDGQNEAPSQTAKKVAEMPGKVVGD